MEEQDLLRMLDGLTKLTPAEEKANPQPMSKNARKKLWRDQKPDPTSNASLKKERNRLANRTPAEVRRDELIEELKRLKDLAAKAQTKAAIDRIESGRGYEGIRKSHAELKKLKQKRKNRYSH